MSWLPNADDQCEIMWRPNVGAQTMFLQSPAREVCYGGAVSGGKTDAIIMGNLRHVAHPKHRSITFRRERSDLQEIIDRQRDIYPIICPGAKWVETRMRWEWPSGAYSFIGSAQRKEDIEAFKSFEFDLINFDELTTFERYQYLYMLSRNRSKSSDLPLWIRGGTNPDGPGHGWVFNRFVKNRSPYAIYKVSSHLPSADGKSTTQVELTQQFIPATVFDNPKVSNRDEYIAGLMAMGPQLAEALLYGKWDYFRGQMFPYGEFGGLREVEPVIKSSEHYVVRCLDYGWSDPLVVYWLVVYPQGIDGEPDIEVVDELAVTETTIPDVAYLIKQRESKLQLDGVEPPAMSAIDPSTKATQATGRSTLDLFEENGLWFTPANNDRQAGWGWMRQLLEKGRIGVWQGRAPYLMHTLPKLVRNPDKADDILDKQDDHGADTLRYGCMEIRDGMAATPTRRRVENMHNRDTAFDSWVGSLQAGGPVDSLESLGDGF